MSAPKPARISDGLIRDSALTLDEYRVTAGPQPCPWCGAIDYEVCCQVNDEDPSVGYSAREYRCDKCMPGLA